MVSVNSAASWVVVGISLTAAYEGRFVGDDFFVIGAVPRRCESYALARAVEPFGDAFWGYGELSNAELSTAGFS